MHTIMRFAFPVAAILLGVGGVAQAGGTPLVEANVPFPFVVNGHNLPAGKYILERDDDAPSVLVLRGEGHNRADLFVIAVFDEGREHQTAQPTLTFKHQGDHYRLVQVTDRDAGQWALRK